MPDKYDPMAGGHQPEEDDDVPFHLPKSADYEDDGPADDDETTDIWNVANSQDVRNMPTMPVSAEPDYPSSPEAKDTQRTLPGSGGLDPNPDLFGPGLTVRNEPVRCQPPPNAAPPYTQ
ncbi:MAG TPA: hypothetical protein VHO69_00390, partial [Phototrophicaceae bacterium]|nr:hypothetical protein [Phototrophicaceae bacterium]